MASLPWGREQRIPHANYLRDLLASLRASLPHATFCCLSARAIGDVLEDVGLVLEAEVAHPSHTPLTR